MRLHGIVGRIVCAGVLIAAPALALAQDGAKQPDEKEMMEAYLKASAPGEAHRRLEAFAGTWTVTAKAWMDPSQPPSESTGTAVVKPIFGGRYFQEEFDGDMMGMRFSGVGLTGYDNGTKSYASTWADSLSTGIMKMEGSYDEASKSFTYTGSYVDPLQGKKTMKIVTRIVDRDTHVNDFFEPTPDGKWVKMMELTYKRK